ncbi:hypothetical protein DFH94DRAFT_681197 [Russula ochroleuca]|uniref:Uncharacterized protein n=1 Tax=Russula ochroleuca TaxID=152965 RepID=A0A9P5TAG0_9AGAM|nr:hypothetical protein DFH94DRAFT_681197 [Russula ochroleuca]
MSGGDGVDRREQHDGIDNGPGKAKCSKLKQMSLFYPGRSDMATFANDSSHFDIESDQFNGSEDNSNVESEGDWFDEPQVMEQAPSTPFKMSEAAARAVALERPVWESPICTSGTISGSTGFSSVTQADGVNTSPEGSGGGADAPLVPDQPDTMWPSDTELIVVPGMNKVTLTIQCPLLCLVFQDAFKNLRVSLLFNNAFPDAAVIPTFIRMALITSAKSHNRASDILKWLLCDEVYMAQMACLNSVGEVWFETDPNSV